MTMQHVPAWKRLGLKLKYANETSVAGEETRPDQSDTSTTSKRKSTPESFDQNNPEPRPKRAKRVNKNQERPAEQDMTTPETKPLKERKSVTFASDTKIEDGDTAQSVPLSTPDSPGTTPKKQPKREKKPKSQRSAAAVPKKSRDALDYLTQHHHDRASWKFNKNREVWILKHVLSTNDIPSTYNAALSGYVYGLKSQGARHRLAQECQTALNREFDQDQDDSADEHARLRVTKHLEGEPGGANEYESWMTSQRREKLILWSLGPLGTVNTPRQNGVGGVHHQSGPQINGSVKPRVKKSKVRTSQIELDSSSSSDSSSSDSDSDSNSDAEVLPSAKKGLSLVRHDGDETSSSGSSSDTTGASEDEDTSSSSDDSD